MNGDVIRRCGRKGFYGGPGELLSPRMCQMDLENSLLVTDGGNGRVQVLNSEGNWFIVTIEQNIKNPSCAWFLRKQLYVAQSEGEFKLFKFYS